MTVRILYYAQFAELAGTSQEDRDVGTGSLADLYARLQEAHGFPLPFERVQVAVNHELSAHHRTLQDGDQVVFLPPVSGG